MLKEILKILEDDARTTAKHISTMTGTPGVEVADFVSQKLAHIEGVQGTVTHFVLKRYKEDGEILEGGRG